MARLPDPKPIWLASAPGRAFEGSFEIPMRGATLVLRGLINGSIRETVTRMQALIGSRRVDIQIDPEAFDRHGITRTPTFVLVTDGAGTEACASRVCGSSRQVVKVAGDVTLDYAMQFLNRGSQGKTRPRQWTPVVRRLEPNVNNTLNAA